MRLATPTHSGVGFIASDRLGGSSPHAAGAAVWDGQGKGLPKTAIVPVEHNPGQSWSVPSPLDALLMVTRLHAKRRLRQANDEAISLHVSGRSPL